MFLFASNSGPFSVGMNLIQTNGECVALFGAPIEKGFLFTGSFEENGHSGRASVGFPIKGSLQGGDAHMEADKVQDVWVVSSLRVVADDGNRVDII